MEYACSYGVYEDIGGDACWEEFLERFPEVESYGKAVGYLISGKDHYILPIGICTHYPLRYHILSVASLAKAGSIVLGDVAWVRLVKSSFTNIVVITVPARALIFLSRTHLDMFEPG